MNLLSKYTGKNETTSFSNFDMATVLKGASSPIEQGDLLARFCGMTNLHFFYCSEQTLWCKWMRFAVSSVAKYFIVDHVDRYSFTIV